MASTSPNLPKLAKEIRDLLQAHPEGLDIHELRSILGIELQQHLDRRLRQLYPLYIIRRVRKGPRTVYYFEGERPPGTWDYENVPKQLRAQVLDAAKGRCQMCGKTIADDQIKLHADHKIPRSWGGATKLENLWAICSACNEGKRDFYATFDPSLMKDVLKHNGVHTRIARLLKLKINEWVDCDLIDFVANFDDYQDDWRKRLRELRYLGFEIDMKREKVGQRHLSFYRLKEWVTVHGDIGKLAKRYERERKKSATEEED